MNFWPFKKKPPETRSSAWGFTAEIMSARESYISGRTGIGELTATAQGCVSLWENGLAMADVSGADMLDRRALAIIGRSLALRGEALFLIKADQLIPCSDWDLKTRNGQPTAYRVSISEAGGGYRKRPWQGRCCISASAAIRSRPTMEPRRSSAPVSRLGC